MLTNANPQSDALCSAFVNGGSGNSIAFMENAELAALHPAFNKFGEYSSDPHVAFDTFVPISTIKKGRFSYSLGHIEPRVLATKNGFLTFDSKQLRDGSAYTSVLFTPITGPIPKIDEGWKIAA